MNRAAFAIASRHQMFGAVPLFDENDYATDAADADPVRFAADVAI